MQRSAPLWNGDWPVDLERQLETILAPAERNAIEIFFRADDIGVPDAGFQRLMRLFGRHRMPLCLAVVPAWIDEDRWRRMQEFAVHDPLWCWHQHGLRHTNHQKSGRKSEFGAHRSDEALRRDLVRGRDHLRTILGPAFFPVFTPPWNRCSLETLQILAREGYAAVSRSTGARPPAGSLIPDLAVAVDLHTRKEQDPARGWRNLLHELATAAGSGRIGIMIHHQLMNDRCFAFLDMLLSLGRRHDALRPCSFRDLLPPGSRDPGTRG